MPLEDSSRDGASAGKAAINGGALVKTFQDLMGGIQTAEPRLSGTLGVEAPPQAPCHFYKPIEDIYPPIVYRRFLTSSESHMGWCWRNPK
jgi:hypothetical protein